tara:strand:- start:1386 stop:1676 length:291 start_codon:yes stop_codon:yes gene_type:complete
MKFLLFALFGAGLSIATLSTEPDSFLIQAPFQECETSAENPNQPKRYYPKKVCNIDKSSINDPEKLSIFITECVRTKGNWLLINSSEANYIDEILY